MAISRFNQVVTAQNNFYFKRKSFIILYTFYTHKTFFGHQTSNYQNYFFDEQCNYFSRLSNG